MTLPMHPGTPIFGPNEPETKRHNKQPFVITPPRKTTHTESTTPSTPKSNSKSTPLHKRFLEEVTMSPGTPCTPPRTPSRSPKRGNGTAKGETLQVGMNGFYFSMEIPERKIVSRAATPDGKVAGRVTPSPEKRSEIKGAGRLTPGRLTPGGLGHGGTSASSKKDIRSEVKVTGTGRVKDILRKNLFGTPKKKGINNGCGGKPEKNESDVRVSLTKDAGHQSRTSTGSGSESTVKGTATKHDTTISIIQKADSSALPSVLLSSSLAPPAMQKSDMPPEQQETPRTLPITPAPITGAAPPLDLRKALTASTPSNIGHLMANHSNKGSKVQAVPSTSGMESMPTPLRKMSERLGLKSPHIVRRENSNGDEPKSFATSKTGITMPQMSALSSSDAATVMDMSRMSAQPGEASATTTNVQLEGGNAIRKENRLTRLLPSPIAISPSIISSRPSTATTPSYPSPSTPSRPGLSSRSKSFGTPARLRSSMQEDMFKVQESLKRSLGQEAFQKNASRPATPISPTATALRPSTSATKRSRSNVKTATRPVSMIGPSKSNATSTTQSVSRRPLNPASRKPRPKSMIVGPGTVLETIALQIDSPRERAKLRRTAAAPSSQLHKRPVSRPETAPSMSRASKPATTTQKPEKTQPTVSTTKPATLCPTARPKRAALPAPTATSGPAKQRVVSAEAIADRVAAWKKEDSQSAAPKPAPRLPVRSKSTKALKKPAVKQTGERAVKTPEPKDAKNDSGTAQSCSYTPPGNPTRLPMSPSKKRLVAPTTPAPAADMRKGPLPSAAAQLRTPLLAKAPANKRMTWVDGQGRSDPNALRTPSKEIQSSLDAAIDRKIAEDRQRAGWL